MVEEKLIVDMRERPEAGTFGRIQSEHFPDLGHVRRGGRGEERREPGNQEAKRVKGRQKGLGHQHGWIYIGKGSWREEQPSLWAGKV